MGESDANNGNSKEPDIPKPDPQAEKQRDRFIQSGLEYWKIQYDFQKHLMTMDILAVAGFVALLGGFFGGDGEWVVGHLIAYLDSIFWLGGSLESTDPLVTGNRFANICIILIFSGFFLSVIAAFRAAQAARLMIGVTHRIREEQDIYYVDRRTAKRYDRRFIAARWLLMAALAILLVFIAGNLIAVASFNL